MDSLTLAALFTAAGAIAAAAVVRQLVELLKAVFPLLDARVSGAVMAFIGAGALYVFAFAATGPFTAEGGFAAFLAWLGCAVGAVGINATVDHVTEVREPAAFPSTDVPHV
jgi:hypothetical protein